MQPAARELQAALRLNPGDMDTLDDLAATYARAGRFNEQIALLKGALQRDPKNDHLAEGLLNAYLIEGKYNDAQALIDQHTFAPRHRTYTVRTEYRQLKYGMGTVAFNKGQYEQALKLFEAALTPPVSLGVDNFTDQSTPRIHYYIGRTLDALGRKDEARKAYEESAARADRIAGAVGTMNADTFYTLFSLDRLGRHQEAADLLKHFKALTADRIDSPDPGRRAATYYLAGLIDQYEGKSEQSRKMMEKAVQLKPDSIGPRFELRGDAIEPEAGKQAEARASSF
jgi:tetratricopeptide (TPR) repeat protein